MEEESTTCDVEGKRRSVVGDDEEEVQQVISKPGEQTVNESESRTEEVQLVIPKQGEQTEDESVSRTEEVQQVIPKQGEQTEDESVSRTEEVQQVIPKQGEQTEDESVSRTEDESESRTTGVTIKEEPMDDLSLEAKDIMEDRQIKSEKNVVKGRPSKAPVKGKRDDALVSTIKLSPKEKPVDDLNQELTGMEDKQDKENTVVISNSKNKPKIKRRRKIKNMPEMGDHQQCQEVYTKVEGNDPQMTNGKHQESGSNVKLSSTLKCGNIKQQQRQKKAKKPKLSKESSSELGPTVDVVFSNVVSSFSLGRELNLVEIAREACNVEIKPNGALEMALRRPPAVACIWSSGKVTCTASKTENILKAIDHVYPIAQEFKRTRNDREEEDFQRKQERKYAYIMSIVDERLSVNNHLICSSYVPPLTHSLPPTSPTSCTPPHHSVTPCPTPHHTHPLTSISPHPLPAPHPTHSLPATHSPNGI
ncbi:hypothetical protein Pmani_029113 [Petrolisthes manimaculis]|uniref:Uncharacterized protein n=1 Tax=Petrolisthes manimaculis TaxID=1843537 RepID=A0AAE1P0V7_9EUCA|nr:hypothetical protein Pmani_029113 [Petrolisthes manimaculis]